MQQIIYFDKNRFLELFCSFFFGCFWLTLGHVDQSQVVPGFVALREKNKKNFNQLSKSSSKNKFCLNPLQSAKSSFEQLLSYSLSFHNKVDLHEKQNKKLNNR